MTTIEDENIKRILEKWYGVLDQDYGEHGDPDSFCHICQEAVELGIKEEA